MPWNVVSRPPCPSPSPRVCPSLCPLNQWCHSTISVCCPLLLLSSVFHRIRVFSNESASSHQVAKVLEFQIQYQSLQRIFRVNFLYHWLVCLLAIQGTVKSLQHHSSKASILQHSAFFMVQPYGPFMVRGVAKNWTWLSNWTEHRSRVFGLMFFTVSVLFNSLHPS